MSDTINSISITLGNTRHTIPHECMYVYRDISAMTCTFGGGMRTDIGKVGTWDKTEEGWDKTLRDCRVAVVLLSLLLKTANAAKCWAGDEIG